MLEIVELNDANENQFWDYVLSDIPRYFFFIADLKQYPENCKLLIALDEIIVGICLIWNNHIAQIRSENPKVIEALYRAIPEDIPVDEITFEEQHKELLYKIVPNPKRKMNMHRMILQKEKMIPRFPLEKPYIEKSLSKQDGVKIAQLMAKADPFFWGNITSDKFRFGANEIYTGLFDGDKLISFTLSWIDETAAIISTVATHPTYQNQGLATYLVNQAVHKLMERTDISLIHVRVDNPPAIKVYTKVGYEVYSTYQNVRL
jgi:ribosomal protein S18 acetylase RimI-like enzyme